MTPNELFDKVEALPGYMASKQQMHFMYTLATRTKRAAEIGAYKGKSSVLIGAAMLNTDGVYFCIDTFEASNAELPKEDTWLAWQDNIRAFGLERHCLAVRGLSYEVTNRVVNDLDWIYIDGDHEYASVVLDALSYYDKLACNGLLLFHDQPWPGVTKATEWLVLHGYMNPITVIDDFGVYIKTGKPLNTELVREFRLQVCQSFTSPTST
jgi:predicted O-methyltransferase YrrM